MLGLLWRTAIRWIPLTVLYNIVPTQVIKMRAELANLNDCAVPFLSRAAVNLWWYHYTRYCRQKYTE